MSVRTNVGIAFLAADGRRSPLQGLFQVSPGMLDLDGDLLPDESLTGEGVRVVRDRIHGDRAATSRRGDALHRGPWLRLRLCEPVRELALRALERTSGPGRSRRAGLSNRIGGGCMRASDRCWRRLWCRRWRGGRGIARAPVRLSVSLAGLVVLALREVAVQRYLSACLNGWYRLPYRYAPELHFRGLCEFREEPLDATLGVYGRVHDDGERATEGGVCRER